MSFYWKYSRSGMLSTTYVSFIIDVLPKFITKTNGQLHWLTSFEELQFFLILLHDVEVLNNSSLGPLKPAFASVVAQLGYQTTSDYRISGVSLWYGTEVIGKHPGSPLPWGYIQFDNTPISLDIQGLQYAAFPNATDGKIPYHHDDKLIHYRKDPNFVKEGVYWDFMPLHTSMIPIFNAMYKTDPERTVKFVFMILKWRPLGDVSNPR